MTTSKFQRCKHCRSPYTYHPSGWVDEPNDSQYCGDCATAIGNVLKNIPVKFEKRFVPTSKYTREEIMALYYDPKTLVRRALPGLYDMSGRRTNQIICQEMPDGQTYSASWWERGDEVDVTEIEICVEVWWDRKKNCVAENQNNVRF